jgi:flagellar operon protein
LQVDKPVGINGPVSNSIDNRPGSSPTKKGNADFSDLLSGKLSEKPLAQNVQPLSKTEGLRFSQHALERMANRGIAFKPEDMAKLNEAVDKAAKKGSRESLVLMGDNAFIVSVKNKTVVTAMDREGMKENVFTNIDSTVIV